MLKQADKWISSTNLVLLSTKISEQMVERV